MFGESKVAYVCGVKVSMFGESEVVCMFAESKSHVWGVEASMFGESKSHVWRVEVACLVEESKVACLGSQSHMYVWRVESRMFGEPKSHVSGEFKFACPGKSEVSIFGDVTKSR